MITGNTSSLRWRCQQLGLSVRVPVSGTGGPRLARRKCLGSRTAPVRLSERVENALAADTIAADTTVAGANLTAVDAVLVLALTVAYCRLLSHQ